MEWVAFATAGLQKSFTGFFVEQRMELNDAALFTILGWVKWVEFSTKSLPNVQSYMKRIYQRPAVQKVLKSEGLLDYL